MSEMTHEDTYTVRSHEGRIVDACFMTTAGNRSSDALEASDSNNASRLMERSELRR